MVRNKIIKRRQFLASIIAAGFSPALLAKSSAKFDSITKEFFVSAQGNQADSYSLTSINKKHDTTQAALQTISTGFRGHGLAQNPVQKNSVILFARRPGKVGMETDLLTGNIKHHFEVAKNRNLQGHGCFSHDGTYLFTAEADSTTGEGKIVVRDTQNYKQLDEIESYGIGPHEIKLLPDGKTLVVANGGIHTRPETGRKKLNLQSMSSNLIYIDLPSAKKLDTFKVSEAKASIRHLDVADDGTVTLAMQVQRDALNHEKVVPLAGVHQPGKAIKLFNEPAIINEKMLDYIGSTAINNLSRLAGFTSPKGNLVVFWNIDSGDFAGYHQLVDVCGLCTSHDQSYFIVSNSLGEIRQLDAFSLKENKSARLRFTNLIWDNHMISASI